MTLESIEKLRRCASERVPGVRGLVCGIADEIEAEIAERERLLKQSKSATEDYYKDMIAEEFMKLPVDADGVPIRVGDWLRYCDFKIQAAALSPERVYWWDEYTDGHWVRGVECRHVKPRTLEDVLADIANDAATMADGKEHRHSPESMAPYASEIRELLGVDE